MDPEKAKANEKQLFEYVNKRDWKQVDLWCDEHIVDNYINHSTVFGESPDREGIKIMFRKIVDIFPDMRLEIDEMIFEDDIMCFRYYMKQLGGSGDVTGICMVKFEGDKLAHRWVYSDAPK